MKRLPILFILALLLALLAGCEDEEGRWPPRRLQKREVAGPIALGAHPAPRPAPPAVALETVAGGLERPVTLAHAGDERIFVALKAGQVRIVGPGGLYQTPFLDIGERVATDGSERGRREGGGPSRGRKRE